MATNITVPPAVETAANTDSNIENRYFYEDEVFSISNGRIKFGLILETYEAGASDTEQSDMEDNLKKGEIRVAWHPRGIEGVTDEKYVCIYLKLIYSNLCFC